MMTEQRKLELVLALFREALDRPSYLTEAQIKKAREFERRFADYVMFNLGFHKAKSTGPDDKLVGLHATETLLPILMGYTEAIQGASRLPEPKPLLGRKPGSYEAWHYDPGYQVVIGMDETQRDGKSLSWRIRWAMTKGWLSKDVEPKAHARRIKLILEREEKEADAALAAMGPNVVRLTTKKKPTKPH